MARPCSSRAWRGSLRRSAGMAGHGGGSRADAAVPGRAKSGRRRPGAQRSPKGSAPDRRELRRASVSASAARRLPRSGGQLGPARSARP
jgi:hypothetical protein